MKSALLALCGAASLLASLSAVACPDFAVIERARDNAHQRHHAKAVECGATNGAPAPGAANDAAKAASAPRAALAPIHTS